MQERLRARLVARGARSDFGRTHDLARVRNYDDFRRALPIRTYAEHAPYIDRVREGDVTALFPPGERIMMFALTSGTTAEPKYIPITPSVLVECRRGWNIWGVNAIADHPASLLRHILQVVSPMDDHAAPSGVPCGAITGLLAATQKKLVRRYYTTPPETAHIPDAAAKYYAIMRFAVPRDVSWAVTANPSTLLLLARAADENRQRLIRDVHDGTLCEELQIPPKIRTALAPRMSPDPAAAGRLERIVAAHGTLYPKHYWRLDFLAHWTGGTMGLYRPQFPRFFGSVPVRDIGLIASEGRMSIPFEDDTADGALAVTSHFFEFIPAGEYGARDPTVLRSHQVRPGEEYFLLLTNASGLWRYDIGDRVRVTGWLGAAPKIEFLSRDAHTASLAGEKLTEDQVVLAMQAACRDAADQLLHFVLAPRWGEPPRYRLYVEAGTVQNSHGLAARLDAALAEANGEYASKRKTLRLGAVEPCELPAGVLAERDRELRRRRAHTAEQFKPQYLLSGPGLDEELASAIDRPPRRAEAASASAGSQP